jgi:hypothetical protein
LFGFGYKQKCHSPWTTVNDDGVYIMTRRFGVGITKMNTYRDEFRDPWILETCI